MQLIMVIGEYSMSLSIENVVASETSPILLCNKKFLDGRMGLIGE